MFVLLRVICRCVIGSQVAVLTLWAIALRRNENKHMNATLNFTREQQESSLSLDACSHQGQHRLLLFASPHSLQMWVDSSIQHHDHDVRQHDNELNAPVQIEGRAACGAAGRGVDDDDADDAIG